MNQARRTWVVGSDADCDIRVTSPYVSSRHCRLVNDDCRWTLEDLGSTNGTFVNGARIYAVVDVSPADRITLGSRVALPWPPGPAAHSAVETIPLPPNRRALTIGRSSACDVVLNLPMVSSRHAVLEPTEDGWRIRDLGSTNGTFVRGRRIDGPAPVASGDVIGLGSCRLQIADDGRSLMERDLPNHASLEARDIAVEAGGRRLIEQISFTVAPGELAAIMGPSGAGKSTLLAALVGAQPPQDGLVLVAGVDLYARYDEFRGQIGYVPQDDIMHSELTVSQALWYAARLRLPRDYSDAEIRQRLDAVISQLGLTGVEGIRIGSSDRRGISGGQRKRVNVAMELVTDPPLLVLDEPTSGLASTDALSLVKLLRGLADAGKTILMTIHQPSSAVMKQINGLAVVARDNSTRQIGQLVWYGPANPDAEQFFEPQGRPDDAESILRGLAGRPVAEWVADYHRTPAYKAWVAQRRGQTLSAGSPSPSRAVSVLDAASQCRTLIHRMIAIKAADRWSTGVLLMQAPIIGLLVAGVFGSRASIQADHGSWADSARAVATTTFLMSLAAIWFGCSNAAREIVAERAIFRRERMVGLSISAYVMSKLVVLAGLCGLQCGVMLLVVRSGCGLLASPSGTWLTLFLASNVAAVIGLCLSAVGRTVETSASALPLVLLPMVILGGILLPLHELPPGATWLADMMPSRWAFEGMLIPEAKARNTLEVLIAGAAGATRVEDLAERWFPLTEWRSGPETANWVLLGMWLLGIAALRQLLRRHEVQRSA